MFKRIKALRVLIGFGTEGISFKGKHFLGCLTRRFIVIPVQST